MNRKKEIITEQHLSSSESLSKGSGPRNKRREQSQGTFYRWNIRAGV